MNSKIKNLCDLSNIPAVSINSENFITYKDSQFSFRKYALNALESDIISTKGEYVYPTVYIKMILSYYQQQISIRIDDENLYLLRVWSNIYRKNHQTMNTNEKYYYLFKLACKCIEFGNI